MANNRLWIVDTEAGDRILLAKGWGHGWVIFHDDDKLSSWLTDRAGAQANGACGCKLRLIAENDE